MVDLTVLSEPGGPPRPAGPSGAPGPAGSPPATELFLDARGTGRLLRVSRHDESGVLVLSLWDTDRCIGTFRLALDDVPAVLELLGAAQPRPAG